MMNNISEKTLNNQITIHDVKEQLGIQKKAFSQKPFPSEKNRKQQLMALKKALIKHKEKLAKAISADFGHRSVDETMLADILPVVMSIDHVIKHLRQWMKSEKREVSWLYQPATNRVVYQPLGVIGIMSPWNYPVLLSFGPLVAAIAAGNKAMIKPSEHTPYANRVLAEIIEEAFLKDEVLMVEGNAKMAADFSSLPFDHLIFTGSTEVGKLVMAAAAKNLTPVTLELGGKSPALVGEDVSADFAVERMLYGKCLNAGQTCVAPDYVLCPESMQDSLIESFQKQFIKLYPNIDCGDYTSVINDAQFARIEAWLDDAVAKGGKLISLGKMSEKHPRSKPLTLLINTDPSMEIMQQEIFAPVLPILTYKNIDEAIDLIKSRPRPLALYLFSNNKELQDNVVKVTHSGGVCINDTVYHVVQDDLPFGGIGPSGMGHYHAKEGFLTFSAAKPILQRGHFYAAKFAFPPYGKLIHKLIYKFLLK